MDAKLAPAWRVGFPSAALLNCPRFLDKETLIRETGGTHAHGSVEKVGVRARLSEIRQMS